jgi:dTDP-L-rhamnose 4-epimerase
VRRILITGGAGFIGSRLARTLIEDDPNRRVLVFDNLHPQVHGDHPAPQDWGRQVQFVHADVRDRNRLSQAVSDIEPDTAFHLAAETGTAQSKECMSRYCDVNVTGTANLLESLQSHAPMLQRVVLASSRAVYGEGTCRNSHGQIMAPSTRSEEDLHAGRFDPTDTDGNVLTPIPTPEDSRPAPVSVYGSTKLMQEYLVQQAATSSAWQPIVLRFQNVYGPGQSLSNPYTGVLSIFCSQILAGTTLNIYEDGHIVRDFVYVDDVVRALVLAGKTGHRVPGPVNIGSGIGTKILDAAKILIDLLGGVKGYRISGQYRAGDIRYAVGDITLARDVLNWRPEVDLQSGLHLLAEWARKHPHVHNTSGRSV